jgi:hypothetical protein
MIFAKVSRIILGGRQMTIIKLGNADNLSVFDDNSIGDLHHEGIDLPQLACCGVRAGVNLLALARHGMYRKQVPVPLDHPRQWQ